MNNWWNDSKIDSRLEKISIANMDILIEGAPSHRFIEEIILHHTWSPTKSQYRGRQTWQGIDRYHEITKGWSDIGYHIGIGPDESLWMLRPLPRSGAHCLYHNSRSIGIVMIGNYDVGEDSDPPIVVTADICAGLCIRYCLKPKDIYFHRDFAQKTCPGTSIDRSEFRHIVKTRLGLSDPETPDDEPDAPEDPDIIVTPPYKVCHITSGGTDVLSQFEYDGDLQITRDDNGNPIGDHGEDQRKFYVQEIEDV